MSTKHIWPGKTLGPLKSHACLVKKQLITMHNMQVHMTVLGVRQYENRFVSTKHAWSGKTLGLSKSKYRHITSDAFLVTCQCSVNPCLLRKCLPWALGHRRGQTLQSAALELGSSWKQRLFYNFYNCLNMRRCKTCWKRSSRFQPD